MTPQPIHPDDYVSDITVDIGLALRASLDGLYPGRIRERLRDSPLTTVPGHTIFVQSSDSLASHREASSTVAAVARILPIVIRDLEQQLTAPHITDTWSVALTWDGHSLFDDGEFVNDGFRFDAYVEVFAEQPR